MEPATPFDLDLAISQYISQVNSGKILSEEEKDQIYDHFRSETSSLQNSGLNVKEAFFVAKMRFGDSDSIQKEFAKAKPWNSLLQAIAAAFVLVLGIKLILNVAKALSFLIILVLKEFSDTSIEAYLNVGDWIFRAGLITSLTYIGYVILTKAKITHIKHLWPVPVLFALSEVASWLVINTIVSNRYFTNRPASYEDPYVMVFSHNSIYTYLIVVGIAIIASLCVLYKNRNQRIQFA